MNSPQDPSDHTPDSPAPPPPILVAACGNLMAGDDEFGPLVVQTIQELDVAHKHWVNVVNLATKPTSLLDHLPGPRLLILVDAAQSPGDQAGQLIEVDWFSPERPSLVHDALLSTHGQSIADDIELARRLDVLPQQVYLVAVTIGQTRIGGSMRHEVRCMVPTAAQRIMDFAHDWLRQFHWRETQGEHPRDA